MSGHSKWSTIKHKKAKEDAKRGKVFTKLIKELTIAARMGGGDADANPRLRTAILTAKSANMPQDNITRAIKKGTGDLEGVSYEEFTYEGYGPGGVALLVNITTDNRNRAANDIRRLFDRNNGNLGEPGCVAWMFDKKGVIAFDKSKVDEDTLMEIALDAGAEDISDEGEIWEVVTEPQDFEGVCKAFDGKDLGYEMAEISMIPQTLVKLEGKQAEQMIKLMDALDDNEDVQQVYANFDISAEEMEKMDV